MTRGTVAEQHVLYFAYDGAGDLLYIGCTKNLERRLASHAIYAQWADQVSYVETAGPWVGRTAFVLERALIEEHRPPYNRPVRVESDLPRQWLSRVAL